MTIVTRFMDMHSGGGIKEGNYEYIYIPLPEEQAIDFFIEKFGHNPTDTACECCGRNYSIIEEDSLDEATSWERGDLSIEEFSKKDTVLIINLK